MTSDPESTLFDFAASNRVPTNEEEKTVTELHAALGTTGVPLRLRRPPVLTPTPRWRNHMHIAITAVLVIAVATAGFFAIQQQSSTPSPTEVPEVVLGLAGQDSTATADNTCELGTSIPVIKGVNASPVDDAALLLTPDGDLILDCVGERETLASGIEEVTPHSWPGVISTWDGETMTYLNIATGDSYVAEDLTQMNSQRNIGSIHARSTNQLIIVPATGSPADAAILDLATLKEEQLFDSNGNPIPIVNIPATTSNYQGDCMVIAYSVHNTRMNSDYLGGFIVFDADGQTQTVDSLELQMPVPREIAISPDCDQIASVSFQGQQMDGTTTITIQEVNVDNSVSIPMDTPDMLTNLLWLKSGDGVVFAAGENLMLLETPFDSSEPTTLHEGIVFDDISLTRDPEVVTAIGMSYGGGPESVPQRTLIIDTSNQEVIELKGYYLLRGRRLQPQEHNVLLVQTTQGQAYDAVTGEHLGEMEGDVELSSSFIGVPRDPFGSGELGIIGSSPYDLWRILDSDGAPMMERIEPPTDAELQGHPMISMSRDGWVFMMQGWDAQTGWMKDLDAPNADWTEVNFDDESEVNTVQFLNTEGLAVSSDATPVASPIASIMREPHEPIPAFGANERDMPLLITYVNSLSDSGDWWPFSPVTSQFQIRFDSEHGFAELEVRNGVEIRSTFNPNIFLAYHADGVHVVNISSLTMNTIQTEMSADDIDRFNAPIYSSRWMVFRDVNLVVDTQTMNVTALNEVLGIPSDQISPFLLSTNEDGSQLLVSITVWDGTQYQWRLAKFNPDGTAELIPATDLMPQPLGLALSPDGERAIVRSLKVEDNKAVDVFTVRDLSTGETIDTYEHPGDLRTSNPVWIDNGNEFVYTNHGTLFRATPGDSDPVPLYEAKGTSLAIYKTRDPNTVVLIQNVSHTSPDPVEMNDPKQIILVDVETGESTVLQGVDQTMSHEPSHTYTRNVILLQNEPNMLSGRELNVAVIDPVAGEQIGTIEREDPGETRPGAVRSGGGFKDGDMRFMSWGSQYTYQVTTAEGEAVIQQISPPPGSASEGDLAVGIRTSNDASWLAMNVEVDDEWWITDLTYSEPQWEQLPEFDQIIFVASPDPDDQDSD